MKKKTTKSSGNVFVDLGFDQAEAVVLQMRANLMSDLRLYIEKGWNKGSDPLNSRFRSSLVPSLSMATA